MNILGLFISSFADAFKKLLAVGTIEKPQFTNTTKYDLTSRDITFKYAPENILRILDFE